MSAIARQPAPLHPDVAAVLEGLDASDGPVDSARVLPPEAYMSPAFYEFETADGLMPIATVRERYLPESRKLLEAHYAACWAEGLPYAVRTRLRTSDGRLLDCVVHGEPEFDALGQVRRVLTERRRAVPFPVISSLQVSNS